MSRPCWGLGLAAALAGHGAVAAAFAVAQTVAPPPRPVEAAILLDLPPPVAPAPSAPVMEQPPPSKPQAPPKPQIPAKAKAKPRPPRPTAAVAPVAPPPPALPAVAETAAAAPSIPEPAAMPAPVAAPVAVPADPQAVPSWQSRLLAHLERHKRYPIQAQTRRMRGVVVVSFVLDRSGMIRAQSVKTSSGHHLLDAAALDMLTRAAPLPPPPPEIQGASIALTVPVKFSLN